MVGLEIVSAGKHHCWLTCVFFQCYIEQHLSSVSLRSSNFVSATPHFFLRRWIQQEAASPQSSGLRHQNEATQGDTGGQLCTFFFFFCLNSVLLYFCWIYCFAEGLTKNVWSPRSTSISAWCADEETKRIDCCCAMAATTVTTPSAWSHLCRTCPKETGAAPSVSQRYLVECYQTSARKKILNVEIIPLWIYLLHAERFCKVYFLRSSCFCSLTGVQQAQGGFRLWAGCEGVHVAELWRDGRPVQVWLFQHACSCMCNPLSCLRIKAFQWWHYIHFVSSRWFPQSWWRRSSGVWSAASRRTSSSSTAPTSARRRWAAGFLSGTARGGY